MISKFIWHDRGIIGWRGNLDFPPFFVLRYCEESFKKIVLVNGVHSFVGWLSLCSYAVLLSYAVFCCYVLCYFMLWCVVLCCVLLYVILYVVMLSYVSYANDILCHVMSYIFFSYALLCYVRDKGSPITARNWKNISNITAYWTRVTGIKYFLGNWGFLGNNTEVSFGVIVREEITMNIFRCEMMEVSFYNLYINVVFLLSL